MGIRLRELREARGYSVAQMIQRLDVKDSRYRKWESNSAQIPLEYACLSADILHCTLDELAGRKTPSSPSLSQREQRVVDAFRSANEQGKVAIEAVAMSQVGMEGKLTDSLREAK